MAKKTTASAQVKGEIALKKQGAEVATLNEDTMSWGDDEVEAKDIMIPKLFVLNPMSALCVEQPDEFRAGDIVRSTDKKVLGNTKEGVNFIPIADTKVWKISKSDGDKFKFVRFEPYTRANADLDWHWEEDGVSWRRDATLNMFCLLPEDIEKERAAMKAFEEGGELPDPDDVVLPSCISFSRTSYASAKILRTHKAKCAQMKMNMAVKVFTLKSRMETKDDNKYFVLDVTAHGKTDREHLKDCKKWFTTIRETAVKVDEEAEESASGSSPSHAQHSADVHTVSDQF